MSSDRASSKGSVFEKKKKRQSVGRDEGAMAGGGIGEVSNRGRGRGRGSRGRGGRGRGKNG